MAEPEESSLIETAGGLLRIILRRRWWFLPVASIIPVATVGVLFQLPNRYTSEATLLVVQQQVPERYVAPTTTTNVSDALQGMTQEVLSRTRLTAIVNELGLYAEERKRQPPERIYGLMVKNIGIEPLEGNSKAGNVNSFKISFTAGSPEVARRVASRLTSLFIAENLRSREQQATNTADFLNAQLQDAALKLAEQEKQVKDFKMQHLGELPEQQQGNLAILAGLHTQLQSTAAALGRADQQRVYLESLAGGLESLATPPSGASGEPEISPAPGPLQDAQVELARLQAERRRLLGIYTPSYPEVIQNNAAIERAEANLSRLQAAEAPATGSGPKTLPRPAAANSQQLTTLAQVKSQLEANRVESENLAKEYKNLQAQIEQYQSRLNQIPVREQQMSGVLRDQELLKQDYSELLKKKLEAELATNLEKQQAGQQFRLVDAPSLPVVPTSPKRLKLSLAGLAAGVFLGLVAAFLVDSRGRPFYSEKAMSRRYPAALVVGIPMLRTRAEERLRHWGRGLEWMGGTALLAAVCATELYVYLHG